ncbi:MAG: helix-turn-helix domain-containing protein [Clostridia bacterium]|nr:helix-turn-helix domain-containing protein [Clostridia bacterium]
MSKIYRTEKNDNYTVMCNHHLKNRELSLKAKGLLSQMLSFPDGWNFNLKGLATLNKDGVDSIRATMNELEAAGYVTRNRSRNEKGQLLGTEYTVREIPQEQPELEKPTLEKPILENPILDNPMLEIPTQENPMLLNTKESSTEESNTEILNIYPSITYTQTSKDDEIDEINREVVRKLFQENISYKILFQDASCYHLDKEQLEEVLELLVDTYCSTKKTIRINGDEIPTGVVKGQLMKLDMTHIQYVMHCMQNNTTKVGNIRSYLLTALYNAPITIKNYYSAEMNHDMYGSTPESEKRNYECGPDDSL